MDNSSSVLRPSFGVSDFVQQWAPNSSVRTSISWLERRVLLNLDKFYDCVIFSLNFGVDGTFLHGHPVKKM